MKSILIKNCSIVLSDKIILGNILIKDGLIENVGVFDVEKDKADLVIDACGHHVLNGFVDMHTHLREPGYEYKEDILSGTKAALKGGYTTVCCMPNTNPFIDNHIVLSYIKERAKAANNCRVYPIGCITKNQGGTELCEMGLMQKAGAIAFSDDGKCVESANMMKLSMQYAKTFDALIISHCEDLSLSEDGQINEGYNSSVCGLQGIPNAAEEIIVAREIILAKSLNTKVHLAHISTKESVELIRRAKKDGVKVTCETCPHYFSLTDDAVVNYDANAKVNPPLRQKADVDAIIKGIIDGTIDAIATDHAPHSINDKNVEFNSAAFGISGLETAFNLSYTNLVKAKHITLEKLNALLSLNPAKILGLNVPEISKGSVADLTIVSVDKENVVDVNGFISKGKNSPFDGFKGFGDILYTIVGGHIKYEKYN